MTNKDLLKKYHKIFGSEAPEPPVYLLPVIIQMRESGKLKVVLNKHGDKMNRLSEELDKMNGNMLRNDKPFLLKDFYVIGYF